MLDFNSLVPSAQDAALDVYDELSRYRGLALLNFVDADGRAHVYVARRFVPPPDSMAQVGQYAVREGDRIDNIAASQFGDPRWWWRINDANAALDSAELTAKPGRVLLITLPPGVPGPTQP